MSDSSTIKITSLPPTLAEVAFEAIKNAIIEGKLSSGHIYSEQALAKELGFSKTPVHEALTSLASKGFVIILPRRGFQITALTKDNVAHMFEFRLPLEQVVIRTITPNLTDQDLEPIDQALAEMKQVRDPALFQKFDRSFHRHLASLTRNPYIINALNNIWDLCDWVGASVLYRQGRYTAAVEEHIQIAKHLHGRDVRKAVQAMEAHLTSTKRKFINSFEQSD